MGTSVSLSGSDLDLSVPINDLPRLRFPSVAMAVSTECSEGKRGYMMPPGCIKGKLAVRARVTGNVGVHHLRGGRSYLDMTEPDR